MLFCLFVCLFSCFSFCIWFSLDCEQSIYSFAQKSVGPNATVTLVRVAATLDYFARENWGEDKTTLNAETRASLRQNIYFCLTRDRGDT